MSSKVEISIQSWVENLQSEGKYAFSITMLQTALPGFSNIAVKSALGRLTKKGLIVSIHKGYYIIIPPQYKSKGILPPALYLDALMNELKRPYYLALLNAAAFQGASHQQPQEFFVVTNFPVLRPTIKKGLKVNYISKKELPDKLLDTKKTEAGYLKISNPLLTATDLIQYEKRVGGINRVATVLSELAEAIKPEAFDNYLLQNVPITALQRLGYLLDKVFGNQALATALYKTLTENNTSLYRVALKPSAPIKGFSSDEKWKVIINTTIEIED
jgi:predicted transcriptional regulator of viral defense system